MSGRLIERDEIRQTVQLAVGAGLAIIVGTMLSQQRWYWALIAAFIVGIGAGSRGEAIVKGLQRLAGTLLGVLVGIGLATILSGHLIIEAVLSLIFVFLAFYAFQAAYGTMIFFITLMLSLLYGMMGLFKPELLELRLEETAIGAVIGMIATTVILPVRQSETFADKLDDFLDALDTTIGEAAKPGRVKDRDDPVRKLTQAMQDLRNAVGALKRGWLRLVDKRYLLAVRAAMRCAYLAREAVYRGRLSDDARDAAQARINAIRNGDTSDGRGSDDDAESDDPLATALLDALARLGQRRAAIAPRR